MAYYNSRDCFWFGTEQKAGWFRTPLQGAEANPIGFSDGGTLLNGGGYEFGSWGSHKEYQFEWGETTPVEWAQLLKQYADGTYGRGLFYFYDLFAMPRNVLPARWADPSMCLGYEGSSLVYGVDPVALATPGWGSSMTTPAVSATYNLTNIVSGFRGREDAVFLPVPTGHGLFLGAAYTFSGTGGVFATPVAHDGTLGTAVKLTTLAPSGPQVVAESFWGDTVKGVWLWVGKSAAGASSVTLSSMTARVLEAATTGVGLTRTNLVTNPSFEAGSGTVEVRRNLVTAPTPVNGPWGNTGFGTGGAGTNAFVAGAGFNGGVGQETIWTTAATTGGSGGFVGRSSADDIPVVAGTIITASMYVEYNQSILSGLRISFYTSAGALVGSPTTGTQATVPANTLHRVSLNNITVPATATRAVIEARTDGLAGTTVGLRRRVSGALVEVTAVLRDFFEGSLSPDPDLVASYVGVANASASILTGTLPANMGASPGGRMAYRSTNWASSGVYSVKILPHTNNDSFAEITSGSLPAIAPLVGKTVTLAATIRLTEAQVSANVSARGFRVSINTSTGAVEPISAGNRVAAPNAPGVYRILQEIQIPANATSWAFVRLMNGDGAGGTAATWWDDFMILEGSYTGGYFDGSTPGAKWNGTANASTSTGALAKDLVSVAAPWVGGMGHSGCRFVGKPTMGLNSPREGGKTGFAATFREVGDSLF